MRAAHRDRSHFWNQQTESLGTARPFGAFAPLIWATAAGTAFSARPSGPWGVFHEVADELLQFVLTELAVFVRIKLEGMFQHACGIGTLRRSALPTGAALASTAGTTWSATLTASGTTLASAILSATTGASTTGAARSALATTTCGSATLAFTSRATSILTLRPLTWATTLRPELLFRQFAIFVLVELGQGFGRALQLIGRDRSIMIGIECFDDRAG